MRLDEGSGHARSKCYREKAWYWSMSLFIADTEYEEQFDMLTRAFENALELDEGGEDSMERMAAVSYLLYSFIISTFIYSNNDIQSP